MIALRNKYDRTTCGGVNWTVAKARVSDHWLCRLWSRTAHEGSPAAGNGGRDGQEMGKHEAH
jgi:hypothetical protein